MTGQKDNPRPEGRHRVLRRIAWAYRTACLLLVTTVLLLVAADAICSWIRGDQADGSARPPAIIEEFGMGALCKAYPGWQEDQVRRLLSETYSRPMEFESFTMFRERPFTGQYVNVRPQGFRLVKDQGPWPPDPACYNVLVFGGSTTFGYGVADGQTIPSHLQQALGTAAGRPVRVYNFGRGFYFSTQERILFQMLLMDGVRPQAAVFIDGINDFAMQPFLYDMLREYVNSEGRSPQPLADFWKQTALNQSLKDIRRWLGRGRKKTPSSRVPAAMVGAPASLKEHSQIVLTRYQANRKQIESVAAAYGVRTIFVWQPAPSHECPSACTPFAFDPRLHPGYAEVVPELRDKPQGDDFFWLADMQKGQARPLYVDRVHYSDEFCRLIAQEIARLARSRKRLPS